MINKQKILFNIYLDKTEIFPTKLTTATIN